MGSQTSLKTTQSGIATPSTLPLDQPLKRGPGLGEALVPKYQSPQAPYKNNSYYEKDMQQIPVKAATPTIVLTGLRI